MLLNRFKNIFGQNKDLTTIFSFSMILAFVKVFVGLILTKIVAFYYGPNYLAIFGNLKNLIGGNQQFSSLGSYSAIVRELSLSNENNKNSVINSSLLILVASSIFTSLLILIFYKSLTIYIFNDPSYSPFIMLLGISNLFLGLNVLFHALFIVNGNEKTFYVLSISIILLNLLISILLFLVIGFNGILLSSILIIALSTIVNGFFIKKHKLIQSISLVNTNRQIVSRILTTSLVVMLVSVIKPFKEIITRNILTENFDIKYSGYWEAINLMSNQFYFIVISFLGVYFLPKISKSKTKDKKIILSTISAISLFLIVGFSFVIIFDKTIINLIFSKEFQLISGLLPYQFTGDLFFLLNSIFIYRLIAKNKNLKYLIIEVLQFSIYVLGLYYLIGNLEFEAAIYAHILSSLLIFTITLLLYIFEENIKEE